MPYLDTVTVASVWATLRSLRCDRTISFLPKRVRVYAFTLTCLRTTISKRKRKQASVGSDTCILFPKVVIIHDDTKVRIIS